MLCENCGNKSRLFNRTGAFTEVGELNGDKVFECNRCGQKLASNVMTGTRMLEERQEIPESRLNKLLEQRARNRAMVDAAVAQHEQLQASANALPRMIENNEAELDPEVLRRNLPRFSDESLELVERSIRLIPDVRNQTLPMMFLIQERTKRGQASRSDFQGVKLVDDSNPAFHEAEMPFELGIVQANLESAIQDLFLINTDNPEEVELLAIFRACSLGSVEPLLLLAEVIPPSLNLPFERSFRALPTALTDPPIASEILYTTTWINMAQAVAIWWPDQQQRLVLGLAQILPTIPEFNTQTIFDLIEMRITSEQIESDPLIRGEIGKLELTTILRSARCLALNQFAGPAGTAMWEDALYASREGLIDAFAPNAELITNLPVPTTFPKRSTRR